MNSTRRLVIAATLILSGQIASAQDMARYRVYALESSVASVIAASGAPSADAKTIHNRPATIQELQWRAPYVTSTDTMADPVRDIAFTFYNDALYQVIVNYDRGRTEGLTDKDILDALSATYGAPGPPSPKTRTTPPADAFSDSVVLARWETAESLMTLLRGAYPREFQLILLSKPLGALAQNAIREAVRLDAADAPRRESEQRKKEAGDAIAARDQTRTTNKAAFRP